MTTLYGPLLARSNINFIMRNIPIQITQGWMLTTAPSQGSMDTLAEALHDWYTAECLPITPSQVFYNGVEVNDWTGPVGYKGLAGPAAPAEGQRVGTPLPNNNTLAFQFSAGLRGRAGRGRNYIPGLLGSDTSGNQVTAGIITAWIIAFSNLRPEGGYIPGGYRWATISEQVGGVTRPAAIGFPVVEVLVTDNTIDSQRGRLHA